MKRRILNTLFYAALSALTGSIGIIGLLMNKPVMLVIGFTICPISIYATFLGLKLIGREYKLKNFEEASRATAEACYKRNQENK